LGRVGLLEALNREGYQKKLGEILKWVESIMAWLVESVKLVRFNDVNQDDPASIPTGGKNIGVLSSKLLLGIQLVTVNKHL
jgi:hypothetical protein